MGIGMNLYVYFSIIMLVLNAVSHTNMIYEVFTYDKELERNVKMFINNHSTTSNSTINKYQISQNNEFQASKNVPDLEHNYSFQLNQTYENPLLDSMSNNTMPTVEAQPPRLCPKDFCG